MSGLRRAALGLLLLSAGCVELVPVEPSARPSVTILSPASDALIPYNTPFHLSAVARAPLGELSQVHVVLRGAVSTQRTIALSGVEANIEVDLVVPQDALLGPDHRRLDLVLIVESAVRGQSVVAPPNGVTLRMQDRTVPGLEVYSPQALPNPPAGIDLALPAQAAFTLGVTAEDAIGGVVRLGFDAPAVLGGLREQRGPARRSARFEAVFSPPANADLEIEVFAEDAAQQSNRASKKLRIRVGRGGQDVTPPELSLRAPPTLECTGSGTISVVATDLDSGVERLWLSIDGAVQERFGPSEALPSTLSWTATLTASAPSGRQHLVRAWARDLFGQSSEVQTATVVSLDTQAPSLSAVFMGPIVPGVATSVQLSAREACGQLESAQLTLTDAAGTSTTVQAVLRGSEHLGPVDFLVPALLCATAPIDLSLTVQDDIANRSVPVTATLLGRDELPPQVGIGLLVPSSGVRPGQEAPLQIELSDPGSGVQSATVTVTLPGSDLTAPLLRTAAVWPSAGCASGRRQSLALAVAIPVDVRLGPGAHLAVTVEAQDHALQATVQTLQVPIIDDAPPEVRFLGPDPLTPLLPGQSSTVTVRVSDLNHDVSQLELRILGPAQVQGLNRVTRAVQAATATLSFALLVDSNAPLGAPVQLEAVATDTSSPANSRQAIWVLSTCRAPTVAGIAPALGPVSGGQSLTLTGAGFAAGAALYVGAVPLAQVQVHSSTRATGRLPPGPHPGGVVDSLVVNACGATLASSPPGPPYRFVNPPSVRAVRPGPSAGTEAGARLFVVAGAQADAVPLAEVGAQLAGQAAVVQPGTSPRETLDADLLVPSTATAAVQLRVWAEDSLGQRSEQTLTLPLDGAQPDQLELWLPHPRIGVGEQVPYAIYSRGRDDRRRDVTRTATLTWGPTVGLQSLGSGLLVGRSVGTATLSAQLAGVQADLQLAVVNDGLDFDPRPLVLSPLVPTGTVSAAPARLHVYRILNGQRTEVSDALSFAVVPATLGIVQGSLLTALSTGAGQIEAQGFGQTVTRPLWVQDRLAVPVNQEVVLGTGQRWLSGQISGEASTPNDGPWTLHIDAGGQLELAASGRLRLSGGPGAVGRPGRAGAGAEPGAGLGASPLSLASGREALTLPSGGGGGASAGRGGDGGHPVGAGAAAGGQVTQPPILGGGGAGGSGAAGGGAGAWAELDLSGASFICEGEIDLSGGPGGTGTGTAGGGGGGAAGRLRIRAATLEGQGRIRAAGGPGGAPAGGGGGGGEVQLVVGAEPGPWLDIDRAGGLGAANLPTEVPAIPGEPGQTTR